MQVQVLVDCAGIDRLLTYKIPEELTVRVGDILTVPLGARYVGAIAVNLDNHLDNSEYELKDVYSVVNTGLFPSDFWQILKLTADYYRTSLIQTAKAALPPNLLDQSSYRIRINPSTATIRNGCPNRLELFTRTSKAAKSPLHCPEITQICCQWIAIAFSPRLYLHLFRATA
jgi:primosomal protein N'